MAIHRITTAKDDFYIGSAGLNEDQLRASFAVLSNDPLGARLWSVWPSAPHAVGAASSSRPKSISIVDGGITYSGLISIASGRVVVDFSQSSAAIHALNAGDVLTGSFYYVDRLTTGRFSSAKVTFTIRGLNDSANITGTATGAVTEDGGLAAGATLTANDPDAGENLFQNPASLAGVYGTFTFNAATGAWGYTLNNAAANVQGLITGQQVTDSLIVTSFDGSDSETITVTVNGANDAATISGTATGTVTEDGTTTAGGTLTVADVDASQNTFLAVAPASLTGTYGTFTFDETTGVWGYTLNNAATVVQSLDGTDSVTDTLTVTSFDSSDTQVITVTINGADDSASISGTATGTVAEDGTLTAGGTLTVTDPDAGENQFQAPASLTGTYGDFTFDAATGVWGYTLNNAAANVQGLITGEQVTDTLTVMSLDGSDSETITVTIDGDDDAATISGDTTGAVAEDGTGTASGTLTVTDVDTDEDVFVAPLPASLAGTYGDFTFDAATGAWDYTLDNAAANVQALITGEQVTDTLTVTSFDGSDSETITITIDGDDDPAVIGGVDTGEVDEDTSLTTSGTLTITDPDAGEEAFVAPVSLAGTYGTFTFDETTGDWTYAIVQDDPAFDTLDDGQTYQDTLDVFSIDNTMHTITVTINGLSELIP
jgi:VCBS repeat-containing protein